MARNPNDVTGRKRDELAKQHSEELQQRAAEMSMITAEAKNDLENPIDATKPNRQTVIVDSVVKTTEDEDSVEIRVIADLDSMTLGSGNYYSFKAGQKYTVSRHVAEHLKEKGYLAGVI
jgi:hypothetical protein